MGQNHHLQMLALVTMERPEAYSAEAIRAARARLFKQLQIPTVAQAAARSFRAQYEGYRAIKGVEPRSNTETFFRVKGFLKSARWEGVPIVMESGKRLGESLKEIEIVLRHQTPCLCPPGKHVKNRIIIHIEPKEGISIAFHSKKPGHALEIEERFFNFDFRGKGGTHAQYTEEYQKLLSDCIAGDQTLFVSNEEIAAMWRFIDPFITAWQKKLVPLRHYAPDSHAIIAEADVAAVVAECQGMSVLPKEIGVFGLGKMGANVARQLHEKGWRVVAANRSPGPVEEIEKEGFETAHAPAELGQKLSSKPHAPSAPRIIWFMITARPKRGTPDRSRALARSQAFGAYPLSMSLSGPPVPRRCLLSSKLTHNARSVLSLQSHPVRRKSA